MLCASLQIQSLWLLRRVLGEHVGPVEWRKTVCAQLLALIGRLWLETHGADPALRPQHAAPSTILEEEVGKIQTPALLRTGRSVVGTHWDSDCRHTG